MLTGQDMLGLAHPLFPVKKAAKQMRSGSAFGVFLDKTFEKTDGDAVKAVRQFIKSAEKEDISIAAIRFQGHWHNDHVIAPVDKVQVIAKRAEKIAVDFPHIACYFSHSCEFNEQNKKEIGKRIRAIEKYSPHCIPVNNPWQGAFFPGVINETHYGHKQPPAPYITSWDGLNSYDYGDINKWHQQHFGAVIRFMWGLRYNLREVTKPGDPPYPPPLQRIAAPSPEYCAALIRLGGREGNPPLAFPNAKPIVKPFLYKTFSEDHPFEDQPWENKPVLIVEGNVPTADIVDCNSALVAKFGNGGDFVDGLHRYYSGRGGSGFWGYQIAQKALKQSGSEFCWAKVGAKLYGPFNPAFRRGYFL